MLVTETPASTSISCMKESECLRLILERLFLLSDVAATKESRDVRKVTIDVFAFRES